ncbi:MAG: hypothetical protein ACK4NW_02080 [Roseinatronobacter sp.]
MIIVPAFRDYGQHQPAWSDDFHDRLREAMRRGVIRSARPSTKAASSGKSGAENVSRRAREARDKIAPQVMAMHRDGGSVRGIGIALGLAQRTVDRIIKENATGGEA